MQKFQVGDRFVKNIDLMKANGFSPDQYDKRIRIVRSVEFDTELGEIIGWGNKNFPAQCNAVWLLKIDTV